MPRHLSSIAVLLAVLSASAIALPRSAYAVDASNANSPRPHTQPPSSEVVMMIGGMAEADADDGTRPLAPLPEPPAPAPATDGAARVSVVIQPGQLMAAAPGRPSASIVARVMAFAPLIDEAARAIDIDRALLMAVIDVESGGNPQAVSPKGATGLMQLMPGTGSRLGVSDLFDPRQNITAGARYLRQLMRQFGDLQVALAAYNAGEGAVQKYGGQIPPYAETMTYVPRVMARYLHYRNAAFAPAERTTATASVTTDAAPGRFLLVRQDPEAPE